MEEDELISPTSLLVRSNSTSTSSLIASTSKLDAVKDNKLKKRKTSTNNSKRTTTTTTTNKKKKTNSKSSEDELDGLTGEEEVAQQQQQQQQKKRVKVGARASIACSTCRKRKIRCSGHWPICEHCTKRGTLCEYDGHPAESGGTVPGAPLPQLVNIAPTLESILPSVETILEALQPFFLHNYDSFYFLHKPSLIASITQGTAPAELVLSILAHAARFYKPLRDLYPSSPNAASEFYAANASQALFNSTSSSGANPSYGLSSADSDVTLVRCQCFLILGLYECTAGIENQNNGWLKLGIANRFAHLLRLGFEDEDEGTTTKIKPDFLLSEIRRRTFWSSFLLERTLTDGKEKPTTLRAPRTELRMPGNDVDFQLARLSQGARLEPNLPPWSVPLRFEKTLQLEQEADLYGQTLRVSEIWQRVSSYIGEGGRNHDRRAPWLLESSFSVLQLEINAFSNSLPPQYQYNDQNLIAHCLIGQGRLFGMLHLLLSTSTLILHRDYIPFLPTVDYQVSNGPVDGEAIYENPIAPINFWTSLLDTAFLAATTISDLCTLLHQHGSQVTHPFSGYAALASGTVHCHLKHWALSPAQSESAARYFNQDVAILNALRDIYPIAAAWCDGIAKLDSLYQNLVRGVIAGDPNKVRASVIRLLRTVKEEEVTSPATRDKVLLPGTGHLHLHGANRENGQQDEASISLLGILNHTGDEEEEEGVQGLLSMTMGGGMNHLNVHLTGNGKGVFETGAENLDESTSNGNQLMANLDLETEYQLDDYVPLYAMDWGMFQLIGGEGALSSLWTG